MEVAKRWSRAKVGRRVGSCERSRESSHLSGRKQTVEASECGEGLESVVLIGVVRPTRTFSPVFSMARRVPSLSARLAQLVF